MKNIHILPTDKPSRLYYKDDNYKLANSTMAIDWYISSAGYKPTNIYITSDEEIKEDDWIGYLNLKKWVPVKYLGGDLIGSEKKIILTTDQDLIKDGVQAIDDEFLEWFVKNPICEEVEVEKTFVTNSGLGYQEYAILDSDFKVLEVVANIPQSSYKIGEVTKLDGYEYITEYKIIIPQEEPKQKKWDKLNKELDDALEEEFGSEESKQETLEEAAERLHKDKYGIFISKDADVKGQLVIDTARAAFLSGMTEGAKWQAERMYSEKEVYDLLCQFPNEEELDLWFEQNKKK
jgi:hypothetical protein